VQAPLGFAFNTKKVRLKRLKARNQRIERPGFQYQKGAIKTVFKQPLFSFAAVFQYQKGAIKTVVQLSLKPPCPSFQYQKGAIKTTDCRT